MNRIKKTIFLFLTICFTLVTFNSCKQPDTEEPKVEKPTVTLTALGSGETTVSFRIESEGAEKLAYIQVSDLNSLPSAQGILSAGVSVKVPGDDITVGGLTAETTYHYAVAASAGTEYSDVQTITLTTGATLGSFTITVAGLTSNAVSYNVAAGVETMPFFVEILSGEDLDHSSNDELVAAVLEKIEASGTSLSDYLAANQKAGSRTGRFTDLTADTDYLLVALGLSSEGTLETSVGKTPFTTPAATPGLTFTLTVSNITTSSAYVSVQPSDKNAYFVWLCQPASNYEGIDVSDPNALAQEYVSRQGGLLDQGAGLYQGDQVIENFGVNSDTKYYLFAFGYVPGIGITSECAFKEFETAHGITADELLTRITVKKVSGRRVTFEVEVALGHENVYYYPVSLPTDMYTADAAKQMVTNDITAYYEMNKNYNSGYTMTDATSSVCYRGNCTGDYAFELMGMEPETSYTLAVVAVSNDGVPSDNINTAEVTTLSVEPSDATYTNEIWGIFSGQDVLDQNIFPNPPSNLGSLAVAVYKLSTSGDIKNKYYNTLVGDFTNKEEEYKTDDDLMHWVPDNPFTVDMTNDDSEYIFSPIYYNDISYYSYTFLTFARNSENVWGPVCRTYVEANSTEVEDITKLKNLVDSLNAVNSVPARILPLVK